MKNNRIFSNNYIIGLLLLGSLLLAACGNNEQSDEVKAEANNNDPDAKEIVIGTGNAYQPFVYLDENGKLTGYEKAVLDEVDQLLPQYKFKYESFEFKNILPALDAGKVDLAAHQYEINDERQKKYLFGKVGYTDYTSYVVVNKASGHDFQSLDDLAGHKVHTSTGSNFAYLLEQYNAKHDRKIDIVYGDGGNEILVKNLQNGTVDAALLTKYDVNKLNKQFNAHLVTSGKPVNVSKTYYLYQKIIQNFKRTLIKPCKN
ncbi:transporter substrate-binding domain-containing protein [Bacillus sp. B6(2022)]|nr:transporter substrate-binding domain-containing protein [Bacillus sp. B6(2022)]